MSFAEARYLIRGRKHPYSYGSSDSTGTFPKLKKNKLNDEIMNKGLLIFPSVCKFYLTYDQYFLCPFNLFRSFLLKIRFKITQNFGFSLNTNAKIFWVFPVFVFLQIQTDNFIKFDEDN